MEDDGESIMLMCVYNDECYFMTVDKRTKLMDIYTSLGRRWNGMNEMTTKLQYQLPNEQLTVRVSNDEDVRHMVRVHIIMKTAICRMVATYHSNEVVDDIDGDEAGCSRPVTPFVECSNEVVNDIEGDEAGCSRPLAPSTNATPFLECSNEVVDDSEGDDEARCSRPLTPSTNASAIKGIGQEFDDAGHFRRVLKSYCIANKRNFNYIQNTPKKVKALCTVEGCKWHIYASFHKRDQSFAVRLCNLEHTCGADNISNQGHKRADANWVASIIKEKLRDTPNYKPCEAVKDIQRDYGVLVPYHQVWLGKRIALTELPEISLRTQSTKRTHSDRGAEPSQVTGPSTRGRKRRVESAAPPPETSHEGPGTLENSTSQEGVNSLNAMINELSQVTGPSTRGRIRRIESTTLPLETSHDAPSTQENNTSQEGVNSLNAMINEMSRNEQIETDVADLNRRYERLEQSVNGSMSLAEENNRLLHELLNRRI